MNELQQLVMHKIEYTVNRVGPLCIVTAKLPRPFFKDSELKRMFTISDAEEMGFTEPDWITHQTERFKDDLLGFMNLPADPHKYLA